MKITLSLILFWSGSLLLTAQYRQLPLDTNHYWQQTYRRVGGLPQDFENCVYTLKVFKDTLLNGKIFKCVETQSVECSSFKPYSESAIIRDDTARRMVTIMVNQQEKILFNFNKNTGDTAIMLSPFGMTTYTLLVKDSVLINDGLYHNRFQFSSDEAGETAPIIEGVGSLGGLLRSWDLNFEMAYELLCFARINPGISIYSSEGPGAFCPNMTGIPSVKNSSRKLAIYPNPSTDVVKLKGDGLTIKSVSIKDILGQTVLHFSDINSQSGELKISGLPQGLYFVIISADGILTTRQLIKN